MKMCKTCGERKGLGLFHNHAGKKDGKRSQCKSCTNARNLKKYHSCTKTRRSHHMASRKHALKKHYGLTLDQYDSMFDSCGGQCQICKSPPEGEYLYVDHCHTTGAVRGLLCQRCNTGLGAFRDSKRNLEEAMRYLETNHSRH